MPIKNALGEKVCIFSGNGINNLLEANKLPCSKYDNFFDFRERKGKKKKEREKETSYYLCI